MATLEKVRTARFTPYRKGMGPTFTLHLYDANARDSAGRWGVCFELKQGSRVLFSSMTLETAAYGHFCIDSDDAVKSVMGWLTLRPGDTDSDYFADYTAEQMAFCEQHAETLGCEVMARYGEE